MTETETRIINGLAAIYKQNKNIMVKLEIIEANQKQIQELPKKPKKDWSSLGKPKEDPEMPADFLMPFEGEQITLDDIPL